MKKITFGLIIGLILGICFLIINKEIIITNYLIPANILLLGVGNFLIPVALGLGLGDFFDDLSEVKNEN